MTDTMQIPEGVRRRALSAGAGRWSVDRRLERVLTELAQTWDRSTGRISTGGTEALVVEATPADGREAVLKLCPPGDATFAEEVRALRAGRGRGYVDIHGHDDAGTKPPAPLDQPEGHIEGVDKPGLVPESLYERQLAERLCGLR